MEMTDSIFSGVQPWPEAEAEQNPRIQMGGNQPPLEERIAMEFEEELRSDELLARIETLVGSAARVPIANVPTASGGILQTLESEDTAKKVGDLLAMARACRKEVESRRETHNRPLLTAQRALKARCDTILQPMDTAMNAIKARLDNFIREERRKADERQREAEEAARRAREEAARAAAEAEAEGREAPPPPVVEAAQVEAPKLRSDMGSTISSRSVWRHEIEVPIKSLPKAILENQKVVDAVNQVIGAMVRGGTREIKGVKVWEDFTANVR